MSNERFKTGQTIPYEGRFEDGSGNGITDADAVISIRRTSNDEYWNGATWQVAFVTNAMTEVSEAQSPGFWRFDFDSSVGNAIDNYVAEMLDTSGNAANKLGLSFSYVGDYIDPLETKIDSQNDSIARILGLVHQNFVLDPTEFSTDNEMTKGDVRIYDTPANATTDNGVTGLLYEFSIDAPRINGMLDKFTQITS